MLTPLKMRRVRIFTVKDNEEIILSALHDMGIMQVEPVSINSDSLTTLIPGESFTKLNELARKVRGLETSLYPSESNDRKLFKSTKELVTAAESISIYDEINDLKDKENSASSSLKVVSENIKALNKISFYTEDLSYLSGSSVVSYIISSSNELVHRLGEMKDLIFLTGEKYTIVVMLKNLESKFAEITKQEKIAIEIVPSKKGKVVDVLKVEEDKREELVRELKSYKDKITEISKKNFGSIAAIREQLDIELKKVDIASKISGTEKSLVLEGWVPNIDYEPMKKVLSGLTNNQIIIELVKTDEIPPTAMRNPRRIKLFEFFIRFYSLPQSVEYDPTLVFAFVFPIFFGLMIGDVGYGLTILLISVWIIRRVDHPPKKSRIPKFIGKFILSMMSRRSLKIIAKAMIPGSIIAIALGILFDNYFGFQFPYPHYTVLSGAGLTKLLLISGYTGVAMVALGLILGFFSNFSNGHKKEAAGKIGWLLVAFSIVILGMEVLKGHSLGPLNPMTNHLALIAFPMLVAGLGTVVYAEKGQALLEVTTIISHILSYTRLVGILLASVSLAYVFDLIFEGTLKHSILFSIFGFIILIVGQLLNLVIAVFEPGIQGARLIYVEFFSKFYKGNGKEFKPFSSPRNYTIKQFSLEPLKRKDRN